MRRILAILTLVLVCASLLGVVVSAEDSALEGMNAETTAPKVSFSDIDWKSIKWNEFDWASVDWIGLLEDKVVPALITGMTLVSSVYIAFLTVKNRVLAASAKFEQAAESANTTAAAANSSAALSKAAQEANAAFQKEYSERMERLEKQQAEEIALMRAEMKAMTGEMTKTREMLRLGFSNVDELVEKGVSREIVKLTEDGNDKETA